MDDVALRPLSSPVAPPAAQQVAVVYVRDRNSEGVIRQCLNDLGVAAPEFIDGGVMTAITDMARRASPRLLIVDVSNVDDPVARVNQLAEVCGPGTGAVVIGDANDITLYRSLKDAGIVEYYFKPLVSSLVMETCNGILTGNPQKRGARTGKLIFVLSVRGGAGATTIAVSAAWHLAEARQRQVMLLDLDIHSGDAALQLDARPSHALREALEHSDRVDDLFLERAVIHVSDRLSLLASLESFSEVFVPDENAVLALIGNLLHRYRYVFVDLPTTLAPRLIHVLHLPSTCLLVSDGSLVSARDVARWRENIGPNSPERSTLHVLNKSGADGSLPDAEFIRAAGQAPDIIIKYDREIGTASNLGVRGVQKCASLQTGLAPIYRLLAGERRKEERSFLQRLFG
jgi:pilus assembly protein CpaE